MDVLQKAYKSGSAGFKAMCFQVCLLMWLRTIMNYQYKNGTSIKETVKILYKNGGLRRFYSGFIPAIIQGPLTRFGDTFANTFILEELKEKNVPLYAKTLLGSLVAGGVRIILTPIDTIKTMMQVEGKKGKEVLTNKMKTGGLTVIYHGALANAVARIMTEYPWFLTHNYLNKYIPKQKEKLKILYRDAFIGFTSSIISDVLSNVVRVVKTLKQTEAVSKSYTEVVRNVVQKSGVKSLFFRGLGIGLFSNGLQGLIFNVMWKYFDSK